MNDDRDRRPQYPGVDRLREDFGNRLLHAAETHPRTRSRASLGRVGMPVVAALALAVVIPASVAVSAGLDDGRPTGPDGQPLPDGPLGAVVVDDKGEMVRCSDGQPLTVTRTEAQAALDDQVAAGKQRPLMPVPTCDDGTVPDEGTTLNEALVEETEDGGITIDGEPVEPAAKSP